MIPFNYLKCDFIEEQLFQYKFFYFYIIAHSSRILQRRPTPKRKNGFTENNFHGESIDNNIYTIYRSVFPYGILLGSKPCTRIQKHLVILRRTWVMTDSTEEDMTMFRWRSTLLQWGIISGNTRN